MKAKKLTLYVNMQNWPVIVKAREKGIKLSSFLIEKLKEELKIRESKNWEDELINRLKEMCKSEPSFKLFVRPMVNWLVKAVEKGQEINPEIIYKYYREEIYKYFLEYRKYTGRQPKLSVVDFCKAIYALIMKIYTKLGIKPVKDRKLRIESAEYGGNVWICSVCRNPYFGSRIFVVNKDGQEFYVCKKCITKVLSPEELSRELEAINDLKNKLETMKTEVLKELCGDV